MADVFSIEHVWISLKGKVALKGGLNDPQLRRSIIAAWREIDEDKALGRRLLLYFCFTGFKQLLTRMVVKYRRMIIKLF